MFIVIVYTFLVYQWKYSVNIEKNPGKKSS